MLKIDKYANTNPLTKNSATFKVGVPFLLILGTLILESRMLFVLNIILCFVLTLMLLKVPLVYYLKVLFVPSAFIVFGSIGVIAQLGLPFESYISSLKILGTDVGITNQSVQLFVDLILRSYSTVMLVFFMALSTPIGQFIWLMKKLKFPELFLEVFLLTYRFIFLILDEAFDLLNAMIIRGGFNDMKKSFHSLGVLIKELFVNIIYRYHKQTTGLAIKNFDGRFHIK